MGKTLNLNIEPQECTQWCWAAVTAAVGSCFQDSQCPTEQCGVVNALVQVGKDCCADCDCKNNPADECNQSRNLGVAFSHFHYNRDGQAGVARLEFEDIQQEIEDDHPVAVSIKLQDEGAATSHAILIFGYTDDGKVKVADPMQAGTQITVSFNDLIAGTASELHGNWEAAYRTKRPDE